MTPTIRKQLVLSLALIAVAAVSLATAAPAEAQGLRPRNDVVYECGSSGPLKAIEFHVGGTPTFLRGRCDVKNGNFWDDVRCDLAWQNNSSNWEFTQVGEGQCKNTIIFRDYRIYQEYILFTQCQGVLQNATCRAPF